MTLYQTSDYAALYQSVTANPSNPVPQMALMDWLLERGESEARAAEAMLWRVYSVWDIWRFVRGSGHGHGIGSGHGRGVGSGYGSGRGSGSGRGIGSGSGYGRGHGRGVGSGNIKPYRMIQMRIGKNYLVHCGDWHTFVGRVVDQIGPGTYEMEKVSKIAETNNGDCWEELAAGNERLRAECDYRHYTTPAVVPLSIAAFEWVGPLPQERGRG